MTPDDVPDEITFITIWSNPPIRVGKHELHGLLERWLPRLDSGCDGWLVVQHNLGSNWLHRWLQAWFPDTLASCARRRARGTSAQGRKSW